MSPNATSQGASSSHGASVVDNGGDRCLPFHLSSDSDKSSAGILLSRPVLPASEPWWARIVNGIPRIMHWGEAPSRVPLQRQACPPTPKIRTSNCVDHISTPAGDIVPVLPLRHSFPALNSTDTSISRLSPSLTTFDKNTYKLSRVGDSGTDPKHDLLHDSFSAGWACVELPGPQAVMIGTAAKWRGCGGGAAVRRDTPPPSHSSPTAPLASVKQFHNDKNATNFLKGVVTPLK